MKTIIQTIGPLYGDDANGTVFGQPNGSVYTPPANTITEEFLNTVKIKTLSSGKAWSCNNDGSTGRATALITVKGQVPWKYIAELATDAAFTSIVTNSGYTDWVLSDGTKFYLEFFGNYVITPGTTYYARARIVTADGLNTMATTTTYTLEGV